jgi:hypothetical protein
MDNKHIDGAANRARAPKRNCRQGHRDKRIQKQGTLDKAKG